MKYELESVVITCSDSRKNRHAIVILKKELNDGLRLELEELFMQTIEL